MKRNTFRRFLAVALLLSLTATSVWAAFAFVGTIQTSVNGAASSANVTKTLTAGNAGMVGISWTAGVVRSISSVSDGTNTWNNAITINNTTTRPGSALYYLTNVAGGSTTVTVTMDAGVDFLDLYFAEYSGMQTATPVDGTNSGQGSSTSATAGSISTTGSSDLVVSHCTAPSVSSVNNSYNLRSTADGNGYADKLNLASGSQSVTMTTTSGAWGCVIAGFKAASAGASPRAMPSVY